MKKLHYQITINAPPEKVWKILWDDASYRRWTSLFSEGSHAVSDWKKGSRILFVGENGDGMVSMIAENKTNEFMSFKHLGMINDGIEDYDSDKAREWAGIHENYYLKERNGSTELTMETETSDEYDAYFRETWPAAMKKIKELSE